jgi:hypothetical protein
MVLITQSETHTTLHEIRAQELPLSSLFLILFVDLNGSCLVELSYTENKECLLYRESLILKNERPEFGEVLI